MSTGYAKKLNGYFHSQYELEEGSTADNVYATFEEDIQYQLGADKVGNREMLVQAANVVRQTPKSERIVKASNVVEDGSKVSFHMYVRYHNPKTGDLDESHTDSEWVFNEDGKVAEVKPQQPEDVARMWEDFN